MRSKESTVEVSAASFGDALREAAQRLGVGTTDLKVEIIDPGSSANSLAGFRPVKVRATRREANAAPDGARPAPPGSRTAGGYGGGHGGGGEHYGRRREHGPRREESFGPPPPPMDPAKITPEIVAMVRGLAEGMIQSMRFDGRVDASKTSHGIRIGIDAGEKDQFLIGKDGETLAAVQHLLGRMIRAKLPEESPPRIEVDVAGYRDRQIESLKQMARDLADEARRTGEEVSTDPLPASERRIVHLEVGEMAGMETVTVGDGYYKRVIVRQATGNSK
jgi:spoIIIJ-associated protein